MMKLKSFILFHVCLIGLLTFLDINSFLTSNYILIVISILTFIAPKEKLGWKLILIIVFYTSIVSHSIRYYKVLNYVEDLDNLPYSYINEMLIGIFLHTVIMFSIASEINRLSVFVRANNS